MGVNSSGSNHPDPLQLEVALTGLNTNGTIDFSIAATSATGLSKLYFDIPFYAFGQSGKGSQWRIKNGLDNFYLDDGNNTGGSILLSVGGPIPIDVTIDPGSL
jgi:hypothetical protein